eukprot:950319_1
MVCYHPRRSLATLPASSSGHSASKRKILSLCGRGFQDIVLTLADVVPQASDVLQESAELFITQFLPSYLALLSSESVDTRFRAFKLFSDMLIPLIRDKC